MSTNPFLSENCQQKKKPECIIGNLFLELFLTTSLIRKDCSLYSVPSTMNFLIIFRLLDRASNFLAIFLQQDILEAEVFMVIVTAKKSCRKIILHIFQDIWNITYGILYEI